MDAPIKTGRIPCPACGRGPRDDTCAVKVDDRGAVWFCHRCHETGACSPEDADRLLVAGSRASVLSPGDPRRALLLFIEKAQLITPDCPAGRYLQARGCALPPPRSHLRWLPKHRHPSGHGGPAMIACVTDAAANAFKTLHRTWINPDGTKAADPPRLWWPGLRKEGVCRLWPNDEVTHGLGIAEGLETALVMAAKGFVPVWAAMDAGNLAAFPVLAGIDALTIAVDHDPAGIKAAQAVGATWRAAGREVWAMFPQKPKSDLADAPWARMEGLPDPEWERRVAEECKASPRGSSATVTEIVRWR